MLFQTTHRHRPVRCRHHCADTLWDHHRTVHRHQRPWPGLLQPEARREKQEALPHPEIPHDEGRHAPRRPDPPPAESGAVHHEDRRLPPEDEPRRAAADLQHLRRPDEHHRAAARPVEPDGSHRGARQALSGHVATSIVRLNSNH